MSCYKLVLVASENDTDGMLNTTRVEQFRVALDLEKFNAYRLPNSEEADLLIKSITTAIEAYEEDSDGYYEGVS